MMKNIFAGILEGLGKAAGNVGNTLMETSVKEAARKQNIADQKDLINYRIGQQVANREPPAPKEPNASMEQLKMKQRYLDIMNRMQRDIRNKKMNPSAPLTVTPEERDWAESAQTLFRTYDNEDDN